MSISRGRYVAMVLGGIALLVVMPRDPWPVWMYVALYGCSIVGSIAGHLRLKGFGRSLVISAGIATLLFIIGGGVADVFLEGPLIVAEYLMWMPLILMFCALYMLAATITVFPIVGSIIHRVRK